MSSGVALYAQEAAASVCVGESAGDDFFPEAPPNASGKLYILTQVYERERREGRKTAEETPADGNAKSSSAAGGAAAAMKGSVDLDGLVSGKQDLGMMISPRPTGKDAPGDGAEGAGAGEKKSEDAEPVEGKGGE